MRIRPTQLQVVRMQHLSSSRKSCLKLIALHSTSLRCTASSTVYGKTADARQQTHYKVLQIPHSATAGDIRAAYVRLSKKVHPDRNPDDPHTHNKFVRLHKAYSVLNDPVQRQAYDQSLQRLHGEHQHETVGSYKAPSSSQQRHEDSDRMAFHDETIWWMRKGGAKEFAENQAPIPQRKKVISLLECGLLVVAGFALFFYSFKKSSENSQKMLKKSQQNVALLHAGRKQRVDLLRQRLDRDKLYTSSSRVEP